MPQHIRLCPSLDTGNHFYGSPDSLGNRYCEFCFAPMPKVTTIDITPVGMQTPEGVARVNAAIKEQDNAILDCANLLGELVMHITDNEETHDVLVDVKAALSRRKAASEAFLRAVAGR
jgi:hypothetical protein